REEVDYLLASLERALPGRGITVDRVAYAWAGVRPLAFEAGKHESAVSREHRIVAEADGSLLSITGTKLTTYRSLAEEATDRVARSLGRPSRSRTARVALDGADTDGDRVEARVWLDASAESARTGLSTRTLERLVETYGRRAGRVLDLVRADPRLGAPLCPHNPEVAAQVTIACREEMARTLADVMLRRTGLGQGACLGRDCAPRVARMMAAELGWDERRVARELADYDSIVGDTVAFREAPAPAGVRG
ncbi:MAG TPA: glycerol-3-phosphate dehydrogenase C-terminal domain-containing protein, partial [Thermodesulfobacteriota bacterium]